MSGVIAKIFEKNEKILKLLVNILNRKWIPSSQSHLNYVQNHHVEQPRVRVLYLFIIRKVKINTVYPEADVPRTRSERRIRDS